MTGRARGEPHLDKWGMCTCCELPPEHCLGHPTFNDGTPYCAVCGQTLCECQELSELDARRDK
jgi:hypothetical protein